MSARHPRAGQAGFTIVELLLAAGILVTMMTLLWGSVSMTSRAKEKSEKAQERVSEVRGALARMAREIGMAYVSQNEPPGIVDRRTYFSAESAGRSMRLAFSAFAHRRMYAESREGDTSIIEYRVDRDPSEPGRQHLWRRETRRLVTRPELEEGRSAQSFVACEDVISLKLQFFDARDREWRERWDTTSADGQPDRLPARVRLELVARDAEGREVAWITEARVHLSEPLSGVWNP
jgi:general secretion pathway protein J